MGADTSGTGENAAAPEGAAHAAAADAKHAGFASDTHPGSAGDTHPGAAGAEPLVQGTATQVIAAEIAAAEQAAQAQAAADPADPAAGGSRHEGQDAEVPTTGSVAKRWAGFPAFRVGFAGALGAGLGWTFFQGIGTLSTVLTYVGLAVFLSLGMEPVIAFLGKRGIPRSWAVVVSVFALVIVAAGVILLIVPTVVAQIQAFITSLPQIIMDIAESEWMQDLSERLGSTNGVVGLLDNLNEWSSNPENIVSLGGGVVAVGAGIANFATGFIIVLILTVYFTATFPALVRGSLALVPASKREFVASVTDEVSRSVGRYVLGQGALAAINGVASFVFLSLLAAPLPALLAFIAFLGSLVPLVGTITASAIIVFSCLMSSPTVAIIAAVYYLIYMQVEAYALNPRIMKKAVNVPGSLVIIAAVAGGTLAGVLGAIVSVPVAASILLIVRRVVIPRQARR